MKLSARFLAGLSVAMLAFLIARRCGIEAWGSIGDACDMAVFSGFATDRILKALREDTPA